MQLYGNRQLDGFFWGGGIHSQGYEHTMDKNYKGCSNFQYLSPHTTSCIIYCVPYEIIQNVFIRMFFF